MSDFIILQIWNECDNKVGTNEEIPSTANVSCIRFHCVCCLFQLLRSLKMLHIVKRTWHSMTVETGLSIYKKWNTVTLHFMYHRSMMAVIRPLIITNQLTSDTNWRSSFLFLWIDIVI